MFVNKKSLSTLALASSLVAGSAWAATTPTTATAAGTTAAKASAVAPMSLRERLSITYAPAVFGPSITEPGMFQPDASAGEAVSAGTPLVLQHNLAVGYKLNKSGLTLTPVVRANQKLRSPEGTNVDKFSLVDPWIKLGKSNIAKIGGVKIGGDVRSYLPFSTWAQEVGRITRIRAVTTLGYDVPRTKLSLGAELFAEGSIFNSSDREARIAKDAALYTVYAGPNVNYQIRDNVGIWALYEVQSGHLASKRGMDMDYLFGDVEFGASWDVNKMVNLSPALNLKTGPGERMNLKTTSLNLYMTIKAL